MLTLKDLSARYELSPKQARRHMESVSHLITPYCRRGPHNTTLVSEQAIPVFDRLSELLRDGFSLPTAAQQISEEMNGKGLAEDKLVENPQRTNGRTGDVVYRDDLVAELRSQVQDLRKERERLLGLLEDSQSQVRQLMLPAPKPTEGYPPQPLTRWQALKTLLLGR